MVLQKKSPKEPTRIQPSREFWQQKVIFQLSWVEFIIIGVYISLREEVGVLLEEPASMIANPLFSLISWFRKQYCHKHKYKYTNIIVNPIFSLVFSYQMLTKTVFFFVAYFRTLWFMVKLSKALTSRYFFLFVLYTLRK